MHLIAHISAFNNNPIYFVDPDGKVGEASVYKVTSKKEAKRLGVKVGETIALVKANFILYGTQASNPNAQAAIPAAEKKWNDAKGTVTITDENGNTVILAVRFLFTSTVVTQRQGEIEQEYVVRVTGVQGGAADIKNNFIRIEASTNLDGTNKSAMLGDNSGYYILSDLYTGSTTPSHEIGHGFGLPHSDLPLETTPDVMVPSGTEVAGGTTNPDSRIVTQKNIEDLNLGKILGNGNTKGGLGKRGGCMFFQDGSWGCSDAYNDNKNKKK